MTIIISAAPGANDPSARHLAFDLDGFEEISGGAGGWEVLQRPRRDTAAAWVGTPEVTLSLPLLLTGLEGLGIGVDKPIDTAVEMLKSWGLPDPTTGEPPILRVLGSRYATASSRWVVQDIAWGEYTRDESGLLVEQLLSLSLLQYRPPALVSGPAAKVRHQKPKDKKKDDDSEKPKRRRRRRRNG